MDILKFITAGSVDDGKSTLIGRLLYDTRSLPQDTLEFLEKEKNLLPGGGVNLALLTDGLRAEREQGITIDVAYKYFATDKRKFIIADTPGHIQYTRNMITGASNVSLAVVLVDARAGIIEQTHRHSFIASMLQIRHLVVAINKMDLVDWSEERFAEIKKAYLNFAAQLDIPDIQFVPVSALNGDNVVHKSEASPWYAGRPLLSLLEEVSLEGDNHFQVPRFPIQGVNRPQSAEHPDYRGYMGQVAGGVFKVGDSVLILPSGESSTIKEIVGLNGSVNEVFAGQPATILLTDDIDLGRGDMLVDPHHTPLLTKELDVQLCWLEKQPLRLGKKYLLRQGAQSVKAIVHKVEYAIDINTYEKISAPEQIGLNDIVRVRLKLAAFLPHDPYQINKHTGNLILIDENTNQTVAAGVILHNPEIANAQISNFDHHTYVI